MQSHDQKLLLQDEATDLEKAEQILDSISPSSEIFKDFVVNASPAMNDSLRYLFALAGSAERHRQWAQEEEAGRCHANQIACRKSKNYVILQGHRNKKKVQAAMESSSEELCSAYNAC